MEKDPIAKVTRQVVRTFPEMEGIAPSVRKDAERFVLTYKGKAEVPGGRMISRIVRVVADERGQIIRISTSR
jgi:hypothetical protein